MPSGGLFFEGGRPFVHLETSGGNSEMEVRRYPNHSTFTLGAKLSDFKNFRYSLQLEHSWMFTLKPLLDLTVYTKSMNLSSLLPETTLAQGR